MKLRGPIPYFHIHVPVSDLYILPILLHQNSWTNRGNTVYKSLTQT
jgi:hypothetical protein